MPKDVLIKYAGGKLKQVPGRLYKYMHVVILCVRLQLSQSGHIYYPVAVAAAAPPPTAGDEQNWKYLFELNFNLSTFKGILKYRGTFLLRRS